MNVDYIHFPNPADTNFAWPSEISLPRVHRNNLLCDLISRISLAFLSDYPLEEIKFPLNSFYWSITDPVVAWNHLNTNIIERFVRTAYLVASVAAFFIPSLKKNLLTSKTVGLLSVGSAALKVTQRVQYHYKNRGKDFSTKSCLYMCRPPSCKKALNKFLKQRALETAITAFFFTLAFKTPIKMALNRTLYCTQSALKNWKITSWEALIESIQGASTLYTVVQGLKLYNGTKEVPYIAREVVDHSYSLLLLAKAISFYMNTRGIAKA